MSTNTSEFEVGLLSINGQDIINSFPPEAQNIKSLKALTQEELQDIASLAWEKIIEDLGNHFWESFADSIREATMEVLELEFDEDYNIEEN